MEPLQLLFFITVYCVSELQRSQTAALETNRTCACPNYSCNFNQVCNPIPNCTRENVALGKLASISSSYSGTGPACLAVDGNTGTTFSSTNCIHSADNNLPAWWQVDLGRAYTVTNITVFIRGGFAERMNGVNITVDGQDCYVFPSGTTDTPEEKQVRCSTPRRGSLVKFQRNGLLNICEVQVWVCQDGFFGKDCNEPCAKCRDDLICDNYFGTCRPVSGDSCSCPFGCNYNQSCMTSNCRKENVALGKSANMSTIYTAVNEPSGPACLAVNGNTGSMYVSTTQQNPNCIHTAPGDGNAWWEVDLGRNYTITDITIYMRQDEQKMMDNVRITVQGKECYNFSTGTSDIPPVRNVSCIAPVQGRIVRLSRSTDVYFLNFCEVQVWVCKPGLYGQNCDNSCNCNNNETCDNFYGSCPAGCSIGYYGFNCTLKCGSCKDISKCDSTNGQCLTGCQAGWQEPMCNVCKSGFYGANCNQTCGKCRHYPCNALDGVCLDGCQDGYETHFCNEICRNKTYGLNCSLPCGRCKNSTPCDVFNGSCTACESHFNLSRCTECIHGSYGEDCNIPCGHCKDGEMCNNTDGVCPDGCEDGYEFPLCNQTCSNRMYGPNCSIECGHCLAGRSCNAANGECPDGCDVGYKTTLCNERYEGEHCTVLLQQTNDRDLTGVIAGSVVGAGLLIGGSIVTAVLIWLRRSILKDKRCPQPSLEDRETHDTSNDDIVMENSNFYENTYDKLDTQEDVAKPYEMLGKEIHVDNDMQFQYQNTSVDSKL